MTEFFDSIKDHLRCPEDHTAMSLETIEDVQCFLCPHGHRYPLQGNVFRFVPSDDYADSFSFEWKLHPRTQYDSPDNPQSTKTFIQKTGIRPEELKGKWVLDAGTGTGRFTDVLARAGANVIAIDLSYAIDVAQENLHQFNNVILLQGNILKLPFADDVFDFVFSIGVLHHTPSPVNAFAELARVTKPGGELAIWVYGAYEGHLPIYQFWRRIARALPRQVFYRLCYLSLPWYYAWNGHRLLMRFWHYILPGFLYHCVPNVPSSKNAKERVLDTFDWYTPEFVNFYFYPEIATWFRQNGFLITDVLHPPVAIRGKKKPDVRP